MCINCKAFSFLKQHSVEVFYSIVVMVSILFLFHLKKAELIPTFFMSGTAAILSYSAYRYTKEKFRLDLLDKRVEIYNKALEFCSLIVTMGGLIQIESNKELLVAAENAAHGSFRGLGYHKTHSLFGQDIVDLFKKLSEAYAYLNTHGQGLQNQTQEQINKHFEHVAYISDLVGQLPIIFKPYIFFGSYKNDLL
ncbi:MAG: hypothetical protein EB059_04060 [Alphaproteobacteria bacterium]|nr:hypothetical protein [Alphaproteobacteria bacterium]